MPNPLKVAAMRWAYPSVHGVRIQIPWDTNAPQYGRYHYAFAKGSRQAIIGYTEGACPHRDRANIELWMKANNPMEMKVGIDCSGFVYRVLDEAAGMSGAPPLVRTLGTSCEYTALDSLTPLHLVINRAIDVRAGDTMRFNNGKHSGVIMETVTDGGGTLREIWYAHSSFTRGPHIGWIEVGNPWAPINAPMQHWHDEMWDGLNDNNLRDLYFTSVHQSPFYQGDRPRLGKVTGMTIYLAGAPIPFTVQPYILGGTAMVHIRPIAEAMGAVITWHQVSHTVTFTRGSRQCSCQIGSMVGVVDGEGYALPEPPVFQGDNVVVPLRFVAESLGYRVTYQPHNQTIHLTRV